MPLVASNRIGKEIMNTFYGGSFIAGPTGEIRAQVRCMSRRQHLICWEHKGKCTVLMLLCLDCGR